MPKNMESFNFSFKDKFKSSRGRSSSVSLDPEGAVRDLDCSWLSRSRRGDDEERSSSLCVSFFFSKKKSVEEAVGLSPNTRRELILVECGILTNAYAWEDSNTMISADERWQ